MQLPYERQLRDKTAAVRERLARFAGGRPVEEVVAAIVPSPLELGYRTSTKLCLSEDSFGTPSIGLYERQSKKVVDIPDCPVQHAGVNRLVKRLFSPSGAPRPPAPFYNHAKRAFQPGCLKFVTVRVSPDTGEAGLVLSHTGVDVAALGAWVKALDLRDVSVFASELRREDEDRILGHNSVHLAGPESFRYRVAGLTFMLTPEAFFQANFALTDAFVAEVTAFAKTPPRDGALLDLYGGFGAYALSAAKSFPKLVLVDANLRAIEAARATAKAAGVAQLAAVHATSEDFLARLRPDVARDVTHLIVNPPRSGLSPRVVERLSRKTFPRLEELVYVSCDPATLARDIAALGRLHGARLLRAVPFDMFPQTDHIEVVARLTPGAAVAPGGPQRTPPGRPRKPHGAARKRPRHS